MTECKKTLLRVDLETLVPYRNNPRINARAVQETKESIRQCTYIAPIVVDEQRVILAGHSRYQALLELGIGEAEVILIEGLSPEQKRKYRLLDNKTAEAGEWDLDRLLTELDGLDFLDFDFGFGSLFDEEEPEPPLQEAEPPEEPEEQIRCPHCGLFFTLPEQGKKAPKGRKTQKRKGT